MSAGEVAAVIDAADSFVGPPPDDRELADLPRNDLGNARRLIARHGHDLVSVDESGWHAWDGQRWTLSGGEAEAIKRGHDTSEAVHDEARAIKDAPPDPLPDENEKDHAKRVADRIEAHHKWAVTSGNTSRVVSMLLAAAPYLRRTQRDMDADPLLLTITNGTLELRADSKLRLRSHDRSDMITRLAPVAFDPEADCPQFRKFLDRVLPDRAIQAFIQRWCGYCLTGDIGEQIMVVFHGQGANGKSTLLALLTELLGDYAMSAGIESFMHNDRKRGGDASPDMARLPGARLVIASEPEVGARLSESIVKTLTGGERVAARHLHKPLFEFRPTFKLVFACNVKPSIRGQDEGIWRRVLMVPFTQTIPEQERVPHLHRKLFEAEGPGILNWALDGFRLWSESGLQVPDAIRAATAEYRHESDPIGEFIRTMTRRVEGASVQARRLYEAYTDWCKAAAVEPVSPTLFGRRLGDLGYHKAKYGSMFYQGLELLPGESAGGVADGDPLDDVPPAASPNDYGV